jgi:coatomer subunit beta'
LTANVEACVDLLISTKRLPEAAFFVHTFLPSRIDEVVALWKQDLSSVSESAASALAAPTENPDLFPEIDIALQVEKMFLGQRDATKGLDLNLIALIKSRSPPQAPPEAESKVPEPEDAEFEDAEDEARKAAEAEAQMAAEAETQTAAEAEAQMTAEAEAQMAAEEAAKKAKEEQAAAEAAAVVESDDFGDEW